MSDRTAEQTFYYLDTSALVKRYAPEVGTDILDDLIVFEADILAGTFHFLEVDNTHIQRGAALLIRHDGLRAYDVLQLAIDLDLEPPEPVFVAAYDTLCDAAEAEGLTVLNPMAGR